MKTIIIFIITFCTLLQSAFSFSGNDRKGEKREIRNKWAFVVGIDEYAEQSLVPLTNASNYGKGVARILKLTYGYRDEHVIQLYNEEASESAIYEAFTKIVENVGYNDSFFAYFLVHDIVGEDGGYYLVPHNGKIDQPWTLISIDRIQKFFLSIRARTMFIVVGTCVEMPRFYEKQFKGLEYDLEAFQMMTYRCIKKGDEVEAMQIFNENFIPALKGEYGVADRRGEISASRLFDYLQKKLRRRGLRMQKFMNPYGTEFSFVPQFDEQIMFLSDQINPDKPEKTRIRAISEMVELARTAEEQRKLVLIPQMGDKLLEIGNDNNETQRVRFRAIEALGQLKYAEAIPGLIAIFQNSADVSLQSTALDALIQIDTAEVLPFLHETLYHPEPGFRIAIVRALVQYKEENLLPELLDLLQNDRNAEVRIAILELIDQFKPLNPDQQEIIMRSLNDRDPGVRQKTVSALSKLGEKQATRQILQLLRTDADEIVRQTSAYALIRLTDETNRSEISRGLVTALKKDDSNLVREAAVYALGKIGDEDAEKRLISIVKNKKENTAVVREAVQALGELRSSKAVDHLIKLLHRNDPEIRLAAARSLGKIGDVRAIAPLIDRLKSEQVGYVSREISKALEKIEPPKTALREQQVFLEGLNDRSPEVRSETIEKLAELNDPELVPYLVAKLADNDYDVRQRVVNILSNYRDDASLEIIMAALDDDYYLKRQGAVKILGNIGRDDFFDILLKHQKDPSSDVRAEVLRAIGKMNDERSLEVLFNGFEDRDVIVREAAAEGLANQIINRYLDEVPGYVPGLVKETFIRSKKALGREHQWTKWFNLLALENPNPSFEIELLLNHLDKRKVAADEPSRGVFVARNGETIEFVINNLSNQKLFFVIIDLSSDGTISLAYPDAAYAASLKPATTMKEKFDAYIADDSDQIIDIIKVFASTEPFKPDFGFQATETRRQKYQKIFVRRDIFSRALAGVGLERIEAAPQGWATTQKIMIIRRGE